MGVIVCFLIALVIAFIVIGVLKSQLKSVEIKTRADGYMGSDALKLQVREDRYTHTTKTRVYSPERDDDDN